MYYFYYYYYIERFWNEYCNIILMQSIEISNTSSIKNKCRIYFLKTTILRNITGVVRNILCEVEILYCHSNAILNRFSLFEFTLPYTNVVKCDFRKIIIWCVTPINNDVLMTVIIYIKYLIHPDHSNIYKINNYYRKDRFQSI